MSIPNYTGECHACGKQYSGIKRKFCTPACRPNYNKPAPKPEPKPCKQCGEMFEPSVRSEKIIYCGQRCREQAKNGRDRGVREYPYRNRFQYRTANTYCATCHRPYYVSPAHQRAVQTCSAECREARTARRVREVEGIRRIAAGYRARVRAEDARRRQVAREAQALVSKWVPCKCAQCGELHDWVERPAGLPTPARKLCAGCRAERDTGRRRKQRRKYGRHHRERAKYYGVPYEHINQIEVFASVGWRCQICGDPAPQSLRGLNRPKSPELDHIVPLSKGGGHVRSNVQCACRQCNIEKGNQSSVGQLNLFGVANM